MKRWIILAAAAALLPAAQAQLYKYVDKNGKTVYSDQAPPDVDSKQVRVPVGTVPSPGKSAVEQSKDADKAKKDSADKQAKADKETERKAQNEARCEQLKSNYQIYVDGGRIQKTNEKGERDFMSDDEIAAARDRTRREMEEACKK